MQKRFEEGNKRQEAKLRAIIQENKTLTEAKDGIDKKLMSQSTSLAILAAQSNGLNSPFGSTPPRTG